MYQNTDILTADPKRLIIMCYEGAIKNLASVKSYYLSQDFENKGRAVQNAIKIISALQESLNFEKGGEIAKHLDLIYSFFVKHILNSDLKKDLEGFDRIIFLLGELKSAWEKALFEDPAHKGIYSYSSLGNYTPL